ncbi:hypothetical protein V3W47_01750 [Deinococcus sp. YIM 134068]|uniref:hypothetical protein n=1 Tax=Deinococcus lichenicola TaxID=3118910 RepID=UPI002F930581
MSRSRFKLELNAGLDEEMGRMARDQGISKAEAITRALTGYANLRRLVSPEAELILRVRGGPGQPDQEHRVVIR